MTEAEVDRWLRFADEDLRLARFVVASEGYAPREACWLAQQAVEKALKAGLIAAAVEVPRIHDLGQLAELLHIDSVLGVAELEWLTLWAVEARYPGDWAEPVDPDAERAVELAVTLVESIRRAIAGR